MSVKKTLVMVDIQNDFCTGGTMAVAGNQQVVSVANKLQPAFDLVIATQDWHPASHLSFAINHSEHTLGEVVEIDDIMQVLWPAHCIQNTVGAAFHPDLSTQRIQHIFHKGVDDRVDSYSAFFDNARRRATGLEDYLRNKGVEEIYLLGFVTDYCVKYSTLDALQLGFRVNVITDACLGIELNPGDVTKSLNEMRAAGAVLIDSETVLKQKIAILAQSEANEILKAEFICE